MEEVSLSFIDSFPRLHTLSRILKEEYRRTRNQTFGKARFPSLLSQLWATDAIIYKTNMVKSFLKAGVFPLNASSIDRRRLLKHTESIIMVPIPDHDQDHGDSTSAIVSPNATSGSLMAVDSVSTPNAGTSSLTFTSSHNALSALDALLDEISTINEDDDDDDYYFPNDPSAKSKIIATPSQIPLSSPKVPVSSSDHHPHSSIAIRSRRKTTIRPHLFDSDSSSDESS